MSASLQTLSKTDRKRLLSLKRRVKVSYQLYPGDSLPAKDERIFCACVVEQLRKVSCLKRNRKNEPDPTYEEGKM